MNAATLQVSANEVRATLCPEYLTEADKRNVLGALYDEARRTDHTYDEYGQSECLLEVHYMNYIITAVHHHDIEPTIVTEYGGETLRDVRELRDDIEVTDVYDCVNDETRTDIRIFLNRKY